MKFLNVENFTFPEMEERVLKRWREAAVFEASLVKNRKKKPFRFYEGPPTANGQPGIHHVLARAFKDIICRFKTMQGFYVERKAGWDTHGLPVELEVEKELGMNTKRDIENYGIAKFNQRSKESVWRYKDEWERLTERIGFWLDMKDPYITYQTPYIETLWWIIKQFWNKRLLYKGHKVVPWCARCGTALSSHEMAQGYKIVADRAVTVKFRVTNYGVHAHPKLKIKNDKPLYILAWTTTPWTLPGNVALAVGENIEYVVRETETNLRRGISGGEVSIQRGYYIIAKDRISAMDALMEGDYFHNTDIVVKGKDLVGLAYEPLFKVPELEKQKAAHKIYSADFVTTEDGTGVVHTAVMYGEDDYQLGIKVGLPKFHTVNESGKFIDSVPAVAGMYARANKTTDAIFEHLKKYGYFLAEEKYEHEYPHCWRCDTALLYYARDSWFVAMSKLKNELLKNNEMVNWTPAHIKHGRFGEWLKDAKDWNFSRARYWGTPLPVWECGDCGHVEVIESRGALAEKLGPAKNNYFAMRHGFAVSNMDNVAAPSDGRFHLTLKGSVQVEKAARKLKKENIDLIVASDVQRTKETALTVARVLGIERIHFDKRLREINVGIFEGSNVRGYHNYYWSQLEKFTVAPPEGETLADVRARVMEALFDLEEQYKGKNILLVSHEYPIWMLYGGALGLSDEETVALRTGKRKDDVIGFAEVLKIPYRILPRNEQRVVDLHRPYIDSVTFACSQCGGLMKRIEELADVWFDSGAMPFAQGHYPFSWDGSRLVRTVPAKLPAKFAYPADYICEAVDQTRGWFYTLLAVGTALGQKAPYRNVISLGHILDKNGEKMSKSKGNVVNPWDMIGKYGSDAIRWHFYTVNPPGEPIKFDEAELGTAMRRFFLTLYNVYIFYDTYADKKAHFLSVSRGNRKNILDAWILARLHEAISETTRQLEHYEVGKAALAIEAFVGDLSRWYVRRSRRRFQKPENRADFVAASATLRECLRVVSLLIAPFAPFFADALHNDLENRKKDLVSAHLVDWPKARKSKVHTQLLLDMENIRALAAEALKIRAEKGIKVRQPLQKLRVATPRVLKKKDLVEILKDEVNVKRVLPGKTTELDLSITPELKEEGIIRELIRYIQDLRRDANYRPVDRVILLVRTEGLLLGVVQRNERLVKKEVGAKVLRYVSGEKQDAEKECILDGEKVVIGIRKV